MQRSKLLIGFVTVLALGGLGVAAFAADGGTGVTTTTTTLVEASTTTTVAPTTTTLATPEAPSTSEVGSGSQGSGVARSTDGCGSGTYANHGDYVSSVAHDAGRQPGDVSTAARSDCGKPLTAVGGSTTSSTMPDEPAPASGAPPAVSPPNDSNAGGHGNAGGNGNAGGHGKPVK